MFLYILVEASIFHDKKEGPQLLTLITNKMLADVSTSCSSFLQGKSEVSPITHQFIGVHIEMRLHHHIISGTKCFFSK